MESTIEYKIDENVLTQDQYEKLIKEKLKRALIYLKLIGHPVGKHCGL